MHIADHARSRQRLMAGASSLRERRRSRLPALLLGIGIALASASSISAAPPAPAIPDAGGVFHACIGPKSTIGTVGFYAVSLIDSSTVPAGNPAPCGVGKNLTTWNQRGINWRGPWSRILPYVPNDGVSSGGSSWIAKRANKNTPPAVGPTWSLLAQKGDTGLQGTKGDTGPAGPNVDATTGNMGSVLIDVEPSSGHPIALTRDSTIAASKLSGTVAPGTGGTGLTSSGTAGNLLRSDGSSWTSSPLQVADVPNLSGLYLQNTTTPQAGTNLAIGGTGTIGGTLSVGGTVNTSGRYQIGGNNALSENVPNQDVFLGPGAGASNTGGYNTASGANALYSNTTGYANTASGYQALYSNTRGNENTASGSEALYSNTTGRANTASGTSALSYNSTGNENTASGWNALVANTTGSYNTASGYQALYANTTGGSNTASGRDALYSNTTGSNLTALGYKADVGLDGLTNATAIGANAVVKESNALVLGPDGSNTSYPAVKVGIGTSTPVQALDVVGNGTFTGEVTAYYFNTSSDRHLKTNIHPVNVQSVLHGIESLPVSTWQFTADPRVKHIGPMAQDLYKAFHLGPDNRHIATVDSEGLALAAIKALAKQNQQQAGRITTQQHQNTAQQRQITSQQQHMSAQDHRITIQQQQIAAQQREIQQMMQRLNQVEGHHSHS